ncbi:MAG TPA: (2Fe-2S)-binding protein [Polyangiaceae bacterium]|jgi:isoquinoline 1-oxidoreductase alpha subunit|nr:(2Fe-2S)-binding protein [Polyangiaceae bacterium]
MITITINDVKHDVDVDADTPLLWVLRDTLGLTGTKYGCGVGQCGACMVHIDGAAARACITPVADAAGKRIMTIEGLARDEDHPVLRAWVKEQVSQCGYCQPGQIMSAAALLKRTPRPTDEDINQAMSGNLCRCGTYSRVRRAIHTASGGGK